VCLEVGFGSGEHLSQQALNNPDKLYIGCEPFVNGIASLLQKIESYQIHNILLFPDSIHLLLKELPDECFGEVFLLFADPWPKKRHHKRRFIQDYTIKEIYRLLKPDGSWKIATDHEGYQQWILEHFEKPEVQEMFGQMLPDMWQRPELKEWPETRYEQKASQKARSPIFLKFKRKKKEEPRKII
jgi:tRNA (guanine-N7-)-methyltransferase